MRHIAGASQAPAGEYDADIVILSLGRPADTAAAIRSALGQMGVRHHVTVFDQGSPPEGLACLAEMIGSDPRATLLGTDRNMGVGAGRNRASAFGHGRTIIALDNDAVFATSGTACAAVAALDASSPLAAVGFRILLGESEADDRLSWGYPKSLFSKAGGRFEAATFVGAGHAIRRAAWEAVGGYDETLHFCWEELDFCLRAISRGFHVEYRGDIAVRHMVAGERRLHWDNGRWRHFVRNRLYLARIHGAGWPFVLALAAGYGIKGVRNGLVTDCLRAYAEAAGLMIQLKRPVPAPVSVREYLARADAAHREKGWRRIRSEVLARLPG